MGAEPTRPLMWTEPHDKRHALLLQRVPFQIVKKAAGEPLRRFAHGIRQEEP